MVMIEGGFIESRVERLYVSDEYKVFLLTGQANGSYRKGYVGVRPFGSLGADQLEKLKSQAAPVDKDSRLSLSSDQANLKVYDGFTGTTSSFPLSELDADIKARLLYKAPGKSGFTDAWEKYTGPNAEAPGTTDGAAPAQAKPLTFKL
ncbi:MAG: hypothetical protein PW788_04705 [Micavibrio sp.]|nr:hypothetical protein [Micavibrio sp.]